MAGHYRHEDDQESYWNDEEGPNYLQVKLEAVNVNPYMFEPLPRQREQASYENESSHSETESDSEPEDQSTERIGNTDW